MSVVVRGMEMPMCCGRCDFNVSSLYCNRTGSEIDRDYEYRERLSDCPISELPEKHGRLGDLDELQSSFRESIDECKKWIKELEETGDNETLVLANQAFCTFVEAALRVKSIPAIAEEEGDG